MKAVVLETYGEPEVLRVADVPEPTPGPDEVIVEVAASALNRADLLQRRGGYPGPKLVYGGRTFDIPGMELAGNVVELGARVTEFELHQPVMAIVSGGGYAERCAVHERQLLPVPSAVSGRDAAAIPEVFITAWDALVVQGGLTSGRIALVHAGASGVGTAAIQIVKAIGARIIVTTSTGKVEACRALGADLVVDYTSEEFVAAALEFTRGRGVDVILDVIGGDYLERNLDALGTQGTIVQVGAMGGGAATFTLGKMLYKRARLIGTVLRARPLEEKAAISRQFGREVVPLFDQGLLKPVIDRHFPLDEVVEAHRYMESNANVGKILLDVT
ncbi:MAG: NAD(P)H-quinone oxidoreductase [Actinobacteria bacterium]|nr:MAG: NAD(P)H-quinone oxidoreductase [Actinomycetota bacterium]